MDNSGLASKNARGRWLEMVGRKMAELVATWLYVAVGCGHAESGVRRGMGPLVATLDRGMAALGHRRAAPHHGITGASRNNGFRLRNGGSRRGNYKA